MLRFAAIPNGDLSITDLRVALFNYILSVQKNEPLIIRIDDVDTKRNVEGADKDIVGLLELFGIAYKDVIYQSGYLKYYRAMALQLIHEKIAFNCFCTQRSLDEKQQQMQSAYHYDDTCLSLTPEQTIDSTAPFRVRLRRPGVNVAFYDLLQGDQSFSPEQIDSFVILNTDKTPTDDFAGAIDDMLSDISAVVSPLANIIHTPRQIAARAALNYTKNIEYIHVPELLNQQGQAFQATDEGYSVKSLLEDGILPSAIAHYLISLNHRIPESGFLLSQAPEWFEFTQIENATKHFNMGKLLEINRQHLLSLDDVELSRFVGFADADIGKLAKLYLSEVNTTKALKQCISTVFSSKTIEQTYSQDAASLKAIMTASPYFDDYTSFIKHLSEKSGMDIARIQTPLRHLVLGEENGPTLEEAYPYIKNYLSEVIK